MEKGPLVQFIDCPGVEIECGPKTSPKIKSELEETLRRILETKMDFNLSQLIDNLKDKGFYYVYGQQEENGKEIDDEEFYPFLVNQYPGIACYKTKRVNFENFFLT